MLMVFVKGFANAGTASAIAASRAIPRTHEFVFMRVNFLSNGIESAALWAGVWPEGVDTHMGGRVLSPVKTPTLPGLTAGKTACHDPAAATAGVFLDLVKNSRVTSCMRIDESLGANVSSSGRKILPLVGTP